MAREMLFNISNINAILQREMSVFLGDSSFSNNYITIIQLLVEEMIYPYIDYDKSGIWDSFADYGVTQESAESFLPNITIILARMFNGIAPQNEPNTHFTVGINQYGVLSVIREEYRQELDSYPDIYLDKIRRSMENGDYVPENQRRMAGF